jgi:hypothetical protein
VEEAGFKSLFLFMGIFEHSWQIEVWNFPENGHFFLNMGQIDNPSLSLIL